MAKKLLIIILVCGLTFGPGCWNRRELNQLAIVFGLGVDRTQDGRVRLTAQIVIPGELAGGGSAGGGGGGSPVLVTTIDGITVFDAVRNFIAINSRRLFFSHNQVIIIGENMARQGLEPVIDFFERDPETRKEVPVLIARGEAGEILNIPGDMEKIPAIEIGDAVKTARFLSKAWEVHYRGFVQKYGSGVSAPVAPAIEAVNIAGKQDFKISGLAVFKKDKMTGWLNEKETRGLLWVLGEVKGGILVVGVPGGEKGKISVEIVRARSKIKPQFRGGRPVISIEIEEEGNIGEVTSPVDITKPELIKQLEKAQGEAIAGEVRAVLSKAQKEYKADIFGFGEALHRADPRQWAALKPRWEEEFPRLEVIITVKTTLRRPGEKTRPTTPK